MKCSKSSVASNTDRNVRPSFSGAIGGHSYLKTQHKLLQHSVFAYKHPSTCTQCFVIDRLHCTTRSLQQQLRTFAQATHAHTYQNHCFIFCTQSHSHIYMIKMHKTVNSTVVLPQREGAHAWRYIHACHSKHTICTVHLQFCKLHDHTIICAQYGLQTQQSNHTPTPQLSTTAWSRRFFSHIQCAGDKLTNSTRRHTQTHTTQRHDYHKFQEQHTSANHSATGTSSDNVTNTYFESRTKAQAHLPCHPS